jgi:MFS family permease
LPELTGLFYGWRMVAAACALRVLGSGLHSFGFTVFFLPLTQDLNLNRTATSLAFSLARAEGAIEGPIVGHLLGRLGPKPIMLAAVLLMGIGYLLLSQVESYVSFLIVYLGVISLAHAGGFMHAPMVLINTWFIRHRARAITVSSAAFGLGGVLIAPILSVVVQAWGWRWGAAIAGVSFLVIGIPLTLTIRRSPESMGLLPDGDMPLSHASGNDGSERKIKSEREVTLAEALRSFAFWGSVLAAGIRNGSYHAIAVHFVPLMVWKGLSQSEAALLLSVYAFLGMALTLILGWFADKANKPRLTAFILFAAAGAMFLPIAGNSLWSLCLFTIFFAAVETTFPLGWAVVGDLFGRKHYAQIRGYMTLFYTWGGVI